MFQEFPKMLYQGEAHQVVDGADQEAAARKDGWHDFGAAPPATPVEGGEKQATDSAQAAPEPAKRGRKPTQQPVEGGEKQE